MRSFRVPTDDNNGDHREDCFFLLKICSDTAFPPPEPFDRRFRIQGHIGEDRRERVNEFSVIELFSEELEDGPMEVPIGAGASGDSRVGEASEVAAAPLFLRMR